MIFEEYIEIKKESVYFFCLFSDSTKSLTNSSTIGERDLFPIIDLNSFNNFESIETDILSLFSELLTFSNIFFASISTFYNDKNNNSLTLKIG